MSHDRFDDECSGCRPMMLDVQTRRPLADDSIEMKIVNRLWNETSVEERLAWHRFTCLNSRTVEDLLFCKAFSDRIQAALEAAVKGPTKS